MLYSTNEFVSSCGSSVLSLLLSFFQSHLQQAHIDKVNGAFSSVDVDKVDMYKFPGLQTIPYYKVLMEPGDCLFIPARLVSLVSFYNLF